MAKVFVSYKYADTAVQALAGVPGPTTARHYVDALANMLTSVEHIYKGENDGESLESLKDTSITSKLGDKIFDSSVTLILLSKNMVNPVLPEKEQWIPWEISYSLRQKNRGDRSSRPNGCIGIIIPDENGNYNHFVESNQCGSCISWHHDSKFPIIRDNMFNRASPNLGNCFGGHQTHQGEDHSYIIPVRWDLFRAMPNTYINMALDAREKLEHYKLSVLI